MLLGIRSRLQDLHTTADEAKSHRTPLAAWKNRRKQESMEVSPAQRSSSAQNLSMTACGWGRLCEAGL